MQCNHNAELMGDGRIIVLETDCNVVKTRSCSSGINGAASLTNHISLEKIDEEFTEETGHFHAYSLNCGISYLIFLLVTKRECSSFYFCDCGAHRW